MIDIIRRVGFTVITQGLLGVMTLFTGIILPKYMGPEQYGYLQQFTFYISYLNLLGLGFNDGLTLNYAGVKKENLPIERIRSAIRIQSIYSLMISLVLTVISIFLLNGNEAFVFVMVGVNVVPVMLICITNAICLATNNSIMYNISNLLQRSLFCVGAFICLLREIQTAKNIILMDTFSFFIVFIIMLCYCKNFFFGKRESWRIGFKEVKILCFSGVTIALSVTILGLMTSCGRIIIEYNESIRTYGIYSFYISVLSIILTFTNAIGVIAFPIMKNVEENALVNLYTKLSLLFQEIGTLMLYVYIFLYLLIKYYMPEYFGEIECLAILFAICYPLGKIQLLIVPYYKAYRKERELLYINIGAMFTMMIGVIAGYILFESILIIAIITLVIILLYYSVLERFLCKKVMMLNKKDGLIDFISPIVFVVMAQGSITEFTICYMIYILIVTIIFRSKYLRLKG